jgi:hypothetical protein
MGTWSYIEGADSRIYGRTSPGNEHSVDLVYQVTWTPASSVDTYPGDSGIFTSGIPLVRQRLPAGVYGSDSFLKTYVCRSVESAPVREGTFVFRVTCRFGSFGPTGDFGYCQVTRSSSIRQAQMWRMGVSFPSNYDAAWPVSADIGGSKVDLRGNPKTYEVPQQNITVEVLWDRTAVVGGSAQGEPPWATWSGYVGQRNSATFLGADIGQLLYRGFQAAPLQEWYKIQHNFVWDAWGHLEQFGIPLPTGMPQCTSGTSVLGVTILQADKIGWMQKYPTKSAISNVLNAQQLSELTSPVPAFP